MRRPAKAPKRRNRWKVVAVVTASLLAGACGDSSGTGATSGKATVGREEFGLSLEQLTLRVEQVEKAIGQCMAKAGFQYVPLDFASVKKAMDSDQSAPGLSDDQFVAQYGYGITTQFDKPIIVFGAGPQNARTLAGLSAQDQTAYKRALWGEQPEWTLVRALEEEDFSLTQGCTRAAAEQYFSAGELAGSYVNPGDKLIQADPRMIAAVKKWSECMRKVGFTYDNPDSVVRDLRTRLDELTRGQNPKALAGPAQQQLKALQGEELAIAKADRKCFDDNIDAVEAKVEKEIYGARPT